MERSTHSCWFSRRRLHLASSFRQHNLDVANLVQRLAAPPTTHVAQTKRQTRKHARCTRKLIHQRNACKKSKPVHSSSWKSPHGYGKSDAIWDHTVLPATRQQRLSRLYLSRSWYTTQRPRRDARLSWPRWRLQFPRQFIGQRRSPVSEINNQAVSWPGGEPSTASRESDVLTTRPPSHPVCSGVCRMMLRGIAIGVGARGQGDRPLFLWLGDKFPIFMPVCMYYIHTVNWSPNHKNAHICMDMAFHEFPGGYPLSLLYWAGAPLPTSP